MDKFDTKNSDEFWSENIEVLFLKDKLTDFFPNKSLTFSENLNAITRCSIYISIILYLYNGDYKLLFIFIITMLLTYMIYYNNKDYLNKKNLISHFHNFGNKKYPVKIVKPTKNNPFMNISLNDYENNPNRESMIKKINNNRLKEDIDKKFNINLYKDVSDIFGKENSQRQFYTTPITTIPNDQTKFAKWLYKVPKTCKEGNGLQCASNNYTRLYSKVKNKF